MPCGRECICIGIPCRGGRLLGGRIVGALAGRIEMVGPAAGLGAEGGIGAATGGGTTGSSIFATIVGTGSGVGVGIVSGVDCGFVGPGFEVGRTRFVGRFPAPPAIAARLGAAGVDGSTTGFATTCGAASTSTNGSGIGSDSGSGSGTRTGTGLGATGLGGAIVRTFAAPARTAGDGIADLAGAAVVVALMCDLGKPFLARSLRASTCSGSRPLS